MVIKYGFRLFILSLLVCAGLAMTVNAGENSLKKGAWALQFQVVQNFQLASFQGGMLSIKRHLSDGTALRVGVSMDLSAESGEGTTTVSDSITASSDLDNDLVSFGLVVQMIKYPSPSAATNFYYGIGPTFTYRSAKNRTFSVNPYDGNTRTADEERTSWHAGVSGVVGIEWFARSNISLMAEYRLSLYYERTEYKSEIRYSTQELERESETNTDGFVLDGSSVKFGLSVYF